MSHDAELKMLVEQLDKAGEENTKFVIFLTGIEDGPDAKYTKVAVYMDGGPIDLTKALAEGLTSVIKDQPKAAPFIAATLTPMLAELSTQLKAIKHKEPSISAFDLVGRLRRWIR